VGNAGTAKAAGPKTRPCTTSRRDIHQAEYAGAFDRADLVTIRLPEAHDNVPADQQLDVPAIVGALRGRGTLATASSDVAELCGSSPAGCRGGT